MECISGFICKLALGQLKFLFYSKYLTLFYPYHSAGRNTSFAQMFLDACLIEDFSMHLSRRHCHYSHSVHFCRQCSGLKPFCKSLNPFWLYSLQAFRFYSLALNCLLYSLITFLRQKKRKKSLSISLKPRIHQEKQLSFCIVLICLNIASQWIIHLVLEFKDPYNANLRVTTWITVHSWSAGTHHWSSSLSHWVVSHWHFTWEGKYFGVCGVHVFDVSSLSTV